MSTTIEIIPVETVSITFGNVLETVQKKINTFLSTLNVKPITIAIKIHDENENYQLSPNLEDQFSWKQNEFIWWTISGTEGGIQVYTDSLKDELIDPDNPWWVFDEMIMNNNSIDDIETLIDKAKQFDTCWYVNRNFGMSAIFYALQGVISATLAELTSGIIWNEDEAWEFDRFPSTSKSFENWYLQEKHATTEEFKTLAKECIEEIVSKFK